MDAWSDSDWAGCRESRKSTSSSWIMFGGHLLGSSSTTQNTIATSSGEAEFYALAKSASRILGAVAMARDLRIFVEPRALVDANTCKECVAQRRLKIEKVAGTENMADAGAKHLA
eukprot:37565-Amphidinium_carterae.1